MEGHHLILGTVRDFLTGAELELTHDEQNRQAIARFLVSTKGFARDDITPRYQLEIRAGDKRAIVPVDFLVRAGQRIAMLIKYGPGSLVTRQRPALAAGRLVAGHQIPWVVVTNGEDAHTLDGYSGKVVSKGLAQIPDKTVLARDTAFREADAIPSRRADMEARILYVYEVDGACPCDTTICRLNA